MEAQLTLNFGRNGEIKKEKRKKREKETVTKRNLETYQTHTRTHMKSHQLFWIQKGSFCHRVKSLHAWFYRDIQKHGNNLNLFLWKNPLRYENSRFAFIRPVVIKSSFTYMWLTANINWWAQPPIHTSHTAHVLFSQGQLHRFHLQLPSSSVFLLV